jgi:hypothetical protein
MFAPLKRPTFRTLWAGMGLSYAGDRLQELAQGWLVATLTSSALVVGGIGMLSSIPISILQGFNNNFDSRFCSTSSRRNNMG